MAEKLTIIVHEYNGNILSLLFNGEGWYADKLEKLIGVKMTTDFMENNQGTLRWGVDLGNWQEIGQKGLKVFIENKKLIYELKESHFKTTKEMVAILEELNKVNFSKLSKKELLNYFNKILALDEDICAEGFSFV